MEVNGYEIEPWANLEAADLQGADLTWANLTWANLKKAQLVEATLTRANLSGADLRGAIFQSGGHHLEWPILLGAYLVGANLAEADLTGAILIGANLAKANLSGAILAEAHLNTANLCETNLSGANLFFAHLEGAYLGGAFADENTTWPEGFDPEAAGVIFDPEAAGVIFGGRRLGFDPETGLPVIAMTGKFGPYVSLGEVSDDGPKPKTVSLFATMTLERVTLGDALGLLSLPRVVGVDPADGEEITVQNGRYGPYLKKGKESRSLDNEEQLLTVTLEECLALLAPPKKRSRGAVKPPLRELGGDPVSGRPMVLKDGQWGLYVTDGEFNASLGKGDSVEEITDERAAELLAKRRNLGPGKKKPE